MSPSAAPGRTALVVLLGLGALDAAAYSVIAPVLPAIAEETGASAAVMGALAASFPLAMLAGIAISGVLIRRGAGGRLLVGSLALLAVGSLGFVVRPSLGLLFLARALMGLGSGGVWMGVTFRTLELWPGGEYRAMSRVYGAYSVGALLGPALGALPGIGLPFGAYLGLVLAALVAVAVGPQTSGSRGYEVDHSWRGLSGFWYSVGGIMVGMLAVGMLDGVLPLHFAGELTQTQIGLAYVVTAVVTATASVGAGLLRPGPALALGAVATTVGITVAGATDQVGWWALALPAIGVGIGCAQTGSTGVLLDRIPTPRLVGAMTAWSQLGMTGYLLAPALGGVIAQSWGYAALGVVPLTMSLVTGALAAVSRR